MTRGRHPYPDGMVAGADIPEPLGRAQTEPFILPIQPEMDMVAVIGAAANQSIGNVDHLAVHNLTGLRGRDRDRRRAVDLRFLG